MAEMDAIRERPHVTFSAPTMRCLIRIYNFLAMQSTGKQGRITTQAPQMLGVTSPSSHWLCLPWSRHIAPRKPLLGPIKGMRPGMGHEITSSLKCMMPFNTLLTENNCNVYFYFSFFTKG